MGRSTLTIADHGDAAGVVGHHVILDQVQEAVLDGNADEHLVARNRFFFLADDQR